MYSNVYDDVKKSETCWRLPASSNLVMLDICHRQRRFRLMLTLSATISHYKLYPLGNITYFTWHGPRGEKIRLFGGWSLANYNSTSTPEKLKLKEFGLGR